MTDVDIPPLAADLDVPRRPLLALILNADRRMRALMEDVLKKYSLSTPEYTAMVILRRFGSLSSAALARKVFVTPQAMGQIIGSIERRGLIERRPDPTHGRRLLAELTPSGRELVNDCVEALTSVERHFLSPLNAREQEYFLSLFTACVMNLDNPLPDEAPGSAEDSSDRA